MTTTTVRALVSLTVTMTVTFALAGCARASQRLVPQEPVTVEMRSPAIRFDNTALERVQVYLVGEQRQWLLGRVEPGELVMLRIPDEALTRRTGFVRLAVLPGGAITVQAAREPRASITVAQPMSALISHQWGYLQGQVSMLGRARPLQR